MRCSQMQRAGIGMTAVEMAGCPGTHPVLVCQAFARLGMAGTMAMHGGASVGWYLARLSGCRPGLCILVG
jgi:hypothetical protein